MHEEWSFRAVTGVNVSRPYEPGSQGPLVLVSMSDEAIPAAAEKVDPAKRIDALTPQQISRFDRGMAELLDRKSAAASNLQKLHADGLSDTHPRVMEGQLVLSEASKAVEDYVKAFREKNRDSVSVYGGGTAVVPVEVHPPQTVLVASVRKDLGAYDRSTGRTVVLFIDGNAAPGEYWLNPDNSVLISFSAYTAPARTRGGLTGSVKVISVDGDKIVADVAIRETTEGDSTLYVDAPYDPINWQIPWVITGRRTFTITNQDDPILRKAAVQWVHGDELKK
jgi:hypothetical protein